MLTKKEIEVMKYRKSGLTQVEVAKKIGISQAAVSSFEKNAFKKMEDAKAVLKIASQLKLNVEGDNK
jgi:transcriptional regulator